MQKESMSLPVTVLATAYAVNPFKGSEDGTGWNLLRQIAREYNVIAITRKNNRPEIERFYRENNDPVANNISFRYYDWPTWARFWKKGGRGSTAYFYCWQMGVAYFAKRQKLQFDIAHALNFHSDSHPNFLWMHGKPTIWGPVGHHPPVPSAHMIREGGVKGWIADRFRWIVKSTFRALDPFFHIAVAKSTQILAVHPGVAAAMRAPAIKTVHFPAVGSNWVPSIENRNQTGGLKLIMAGRMVGMKAFGMAIRSFAAFYQTLTKEERADVSLTLCGKGPLEKELRLLAEKLGVSEKVIFAGWVDRAKMLALYTAANAFLFPSHEGAGMVVPEALSNGLPVICFDNYGPGALVSSDCAISIECRDYESTVRDFAGALDRLHNNLQLRFSMSQAARAHFEDCFLWERKGDRLLQLYKKFVPAEAQSTTDQQQSNESLNSKARVA